MTDLRSRENVGLGPVDPDGDLSTGGAEFLEESAVSADPQVLLCDFHLKQSIITTWDERMKGLVWV